MHPAPSPALAPPQQPRGTPADYLAIARLDHSTKHVFIIPGIALAWLLRGVGTEAPALHIVLGFTAALCLASANYVLNEWLDRDFDRHHPDKSGRAAVQRELSSQWVAVEWLAFLGLGLVAAALASPTMLAVAAAFALQGVVYNVPPLRSKEKAYLDVISESINNPLRLLIGWVMIDPGSLPPASVLLSYWLGGAFLMAAKRLSEYREIVAAHGKGLLVRYRASFAGYTETSLTVSCFVYAMSSSFLLAVFLIKYRIEYVVVVPLVIALFAHYLALSMQAGSAAQKPEKLFRERGLVVLAALITITFAVTTFVRIPGLQFLAEQRFILVL